MAQGGTILQVRLDGELKRALVEASARAQTTPSKVVRELIEKFVRASYRAEAQRQSCIVAGAADYDETMDDIARATEWLHD